MPIIDMPLEQLKQYQGRTPRPKDFDSYWERALGEMNALDPKQELIPAEFQTTNVECFHLYFTGTKGARVHAKLLRPRKIEGPCPALLQFHGYGGYSGDWWSLLPYAQEGFVVAALDCRGQSGLSEDVCGVKGNTLHGQFIRGLDDHEDMLLFRDIFLDTALLAKLVMEMPQVDEKRVGVTGGSQGGALTIACAALVPSVALAAPYYPFLSDYQRVWEMDLASGAYSELKEYFRFFDPRHEREEEIFTKLGYIDIQNLAPRIRAKVTMAVGLMDTTCPPSTQFAAYNKMTCEKELVIYPDYGHEGLRGWGDIVFQKMMELKS